MGRGIVDGSVTRHTRWVCLDEASPIANTQLRIQIRRQMFRDDWKIDEAHRQGIFSWDKKPVGTLETLSVLKANQADRGPGTAARILAGNNTFFYTDDEYRGLVVLYWR